MDQPMQLLTFGRLASLTEQEREASVDVAKRNTLEDLTFRRYHLKRMSDTCESSQVARGYTPDLNLCIYMYVTLLSE